MSLSAYHDLIASKPFLVKPSVIYGLVDPRTNQIRYIGKTNQPLNSRLSAHLRDMSSCHRVHWLNELATLGLRPAIVVLEQVEGAWPWQESERYWIAQAKADGWPLTNNTSGGDGVADLPAATRQRISSVWIGRKHSAETKRKIGASSAERRHSPERRARMSAKMAGRVISWTDKISAANRKLSAEQVAEIQSRLATGELSKALAAEFGVHKDTIKIVKRGDYLKFGQGRPQ